MDNLFFLRERRPSTTHLNCNFVFIQTLMIVKMETNQNRQKFLAALQH